MKIWDLVKRKQATEVDDLVEEAATELRRLQAELESARAARKEALVQEQLTGKSADSAKKATVLLEEQVEQQEARLEALSRALAAKELEEANVRRAQLVVEAEALTKQYAAWKEKQLEYRREYLRLDDEFDAIRGRFGQLQGESRQLHEAYQLDPVVINCDPQPINWKDILDAGIEPKWA